MYLASPAGQIKSLVITLASAVTTALSVVVHSSRAYIALNESAADADNVCVYDSLVKGVVKNTGEAWAIGQAIYWDAVNSEFTTTSTSNTLCGFAAAAAASADAAGDILFNSFAAIS